MSDRHTLSARTDAIIASHDRERECKLMSDIMLDCKFFYRGTPSPTITYKPLHLAQLGSGGFETYKRTFKVEEERMCASVRSALHTWMYADTDMYNNGSPEYKELVDWVTAQLKIEEEGKVG